MLRFKYNIKTKCESTKYTELTISMKVNPSWETTSYSATQEFPKLFLNPKVHYRVYKNPPVVPILSQICPVHTTPPYFSQIHFNIVFPVMSRSS
jgi:hypothetical protein